MIDGLSTTLLTIDRAVGLPVAPHVAARIGAFAQGDPRTIRDVAKELSPVQLRGGAALPIPLPAVDSARHKELDQFSVAERRLLLFTALSMTRLVADLLDAAALEPDVLLFGGLQSVLGVENGRVTFGDDRIRSQIIAESDAMEQQSAHRALARTARRRDDRLARTWHFAHADSTPPVHAIHALLAAANSHLSRGEVDHARTIARFASETSSGELALKAWATAGLASFWAGELDDAKECLDRVSGAGDQNHVVEADAALYAREMLIDGPDDLFRADESARIFSSLVTAARTPADREALTQLSAVADALYGRPHEADSLQARLFLSLRDSPGRLHLTPHAEAHVIMMQVAFQSQAGDRAGAARLLRSAVPRLPLVLPAAGIVSSYLQILSEFDPAFDDTLIAAYDAIGPAHPLRYDGDGSSIGHDHDVGARATAAARIASSGGSTSVSAPHPPTSPTAPLSPREHDVLALLVAGRSNQSIAEALRISHRTVEVHVSNVLRKHEVRSRTKLLSLMVGRGMPRPYAPWPPALDES